MTAIARSLGEKFKSQGFALLAFGEDAREGRVSYVSNCGRGSVLEALRALASLRAEVAGVVVAFSHDLTPPGWEPVRHLSIRAADGSAPAPGLVREVARAFGMEGCRFRPAPPPHGGDALHAFLPVREGAAVPAAADVPGDRPRWTQ